ncbi:pilus assembly protein Flp/PilA [Fontimonas thermophila]|uniref:Pilus assembly protein Flp/PilA n=1 Tax=Fontimonas thermophila TaxID=1076937 RepID=A0A1I2I859_9GAMM|nr:Flp family type IVb pilin [Fontimonas thermophila]SFF38619.1 pilus assembly protein Flp/PilA [Fontimonas thermophila]
MLKKCLELFRAFAKDEEGATAIEYGLIVGLIAIALIAVLLLVGGEQGLGGLFNTVATEVQNASSTTP